MHDLNDATSGGETASLPVAMGGEQLEISSEQLEEQLEALVSHWIDGQNVSKLLILPPDHTRLYSRAGEITAWLWQKLVGRVKVDLMPALGTHAPMTREQCYLMFGPLVPYEIILPHLWREDLSRLGELSAEEIEDLSGGRFGQPIPAEVNKRVVEGDYDLVLSIGQVVPHEVIGFANYTKNVCIGAGGQATINGSHFLGAVCDMETIMGRADTPVRQAIDTLFDRFVRPRANVNFILTVVEEATDGPVLRGLFAGNDGECFARAAELSRAVNVTTLDRPLPRCVVYLDPREFQSTWLGNKSIYRTRMAMADGGELLVLAPEVKTFGEDPEIDRMIRRHGYRGRDAVLDAVGADPDLANNLSAAAHLIHGSSEDRFSITYCTASSITREEIEGVGYAHRPFEEVSQDYELDGLTDGWHDGPDGEPFYFIRNPALGLWSTSERLSPP